MENDGNSTRRMTSLHLEEEKRYLEALKKLAREKGTSTNALLRELIRTYLKKHAA